MRIEIVVLFIAACTPTPSPTPPSPDSGDAGVVCEVACAALASAGCPEGLASSCVRTCQHVEATRLTDLHVSCLATVKTKDDAMRCGVRCASVFMPP